MSFSYLASPYSHPDAEVRQKRFEAVMQHVADLCRFKIVAYSPILHFHPLAIAHDLPTDAAFWAKHNRTMLEAANSLLILRLPGWEESKGVALEIEWAREARKLITFEDPTA